LSIQCKWKKADGQEEDIIVSPQVMEQVNGHAKVLTEGEDLSARCPLFLRFTASLGAITEYLHSNRVIGFTGHGHAKD